MYLAASYYGLYDYCLEYIPQSTYAKGFVKAIMLLAGFLWSSGQANVITLDPCQLTAV